MMDILILGRLLDQTKDIVEKEREAEKFRPGKMCLLKMFRHSYENSHSDVLAYLLDPKEEHKHGIEYLRNFLETVGLRDLASKDLSQTDIVREEGRIDIYLKHPEFYIIIENKIDAYDQPQQLSRYKNKAKADSGSIEKIYILYLTKLRTPPSGSSTDKDEELKQMEKSGRMRLISYKNEILHWLQHLSFNSSEYTLRSAIEQYIYTVEILTNQTEEENTMLKEFVELIGSHDFSAKELEELGEAVEQCRRLKLAEPWIELFETLNKDATLKEEVIKNHHKFVLIYNQKPYDTPAEFKAAVAVKERNFYMGVGINIKENLSVILEKNMDNDKLWVGLGVHHQPQGKLSKRVEDYMNSGNQSHKWVVEDKSHGWWYAWKYINASPPFSKEAFEEIKMLYKNIGE